MSHLSLFTKDMDLRLIQMVKQNPLIYNSGHTKYTDGDSREVVWQRIGDELNRSPNRCKTRWLNIRDMLRRSVRRRQLPNQSAPKYYRYEDELSFLVPFLKCVTEENLSEYLDNSEIEVEVHPFADSEDAQSIDPIAFESDAEGKKRGKKRKIKEEPSSSQFDEENSSLNVSPKPQVTNNTSQDMTSTSQTAKTSQALTVPALGLQSDSLDVFLLSIGTMMRNFSPYYLNQTKSKLFQIVLEYELEQIINKNPRGEEK